MKSEVKAIFRLAEQEAIMEVFGKKEKPQPYEAEAELYFFEIFKKRLTRNDLVWLQDV